MRVAHISIIPSFSPGIFKKISDKAEISRRVGFDIDFYLINPEEACQDSNLFVLKKDYFWVPTQFLRTIFFRLFKINSLMRMVDLDKYDAIVLRYPLMDGFGYAEYAKKFGDKTVTEHHTDEISELFALDRFIDTVRGYIEKFRSGRFLAKVAGVIAVTDEVKVVQIKKANKDLPSLSIANGINPSSYSKTGFTPFDGEQLNMIFIASEFFLWQGLESLLNNLKVYHGSVLVNLHLVGCVDSDQLDLIREAQHENSVILTHGRLYGEELDRLMQKMNIGISTLGLSRKNMSEACPLKSREYIVRGLPFVYAYDDTDFVGDEIFAKKISEDGYAIDDFIKFAKDVSLNVTETQKSMQSFIRVISWEAKMYSMLDFIKKNLTIDTQAR